MKDQLNQLFHFPISTGLFPPHSMLHKHIHSYFAFSLHERAVVVLFPKWKKSPCLLGLIAASSTRHSWAWIFLGGSRRLRHRQLKAPAKALLHGYGTAINCSQSVNSLSNEWYNCINTYFSTKQFNTRQVQVQTRPKGLWVNFKGQQFFRVHVV